MQRMSGIATLTQKYVQAVSHTRAKILDTRKTTPNSRLIEKWAVRIGGGTNHRFGLFDMIMLKDNHVDFAGGIRAAITAAHRYLEKHQQKLPIEIETRNLDEVEEVLKVGGVDVIMLDNMSIDAMKAAVALIGGRFETEASGGITLETIAAVAETGVDSISVGALTHSYQSIDLSLKAKK
jgi:nicotinate-nucleotide pyrophosphorylase (carboxylating)